MTTVAATTGSARGACRVERRAHRGGKPPPHAPHGPREGVVRDGREAVLVGPQGQQQVRDAVRRRQLGLRGPDAEAVDPAARQQQGSGFADEPGAELTALEREARVALELALAMAEQVAEEALGD